MNTSEINSPAEWLDTYDRVATDVRTLSADIREKQNSAMGLQPRDKRPFNRKCKKWTLALYFLPCYLRFIY